MKLFTDKWSGSAAFEFAPLRDRDALMDAYERSGKTPLGFAADLGVDPATFELWLKIKHGSNCGATRSDAVQFVEAVPCWGFGLRVDGGSGPVWPEWSRLCSLVLWCGHECQRTLGFGGRSRRSCRQKTKEFKKDLGCFRNRKKLTKNQ